MLSYNFTAFVDVPRAEELARKALLAVPTLTNISIYGVTRPTYHLYWTVVGERSEARLQREHQPSVMNSLVRPTLLPEFPVRSFDLLSASLWLTTSLRHSFVIQECFDDTVWGITFLGTL